MIPSIFAVHIIFALIDSDAVLNEAAKHDFLYRNVEISTVEKCSDTDTCISSGGKNYLIKRKDSVSVECIAENGKITINITPEQTYISYFLYIEHKAGIQKIQMNKKNIVIDSGVPNIYRIQLVGTAPTGPVIIWGKAFKESPVHKFDSSFTVSLNKLRLSYSLKPLAVDEDLKSAAEQSLRKVVSEGLIHYSAKTGSIRHSGVAKKVFGENLFIAESEQRAWEMMVKSPSHLYNLINPQFGKFYFLDSKNDGVLKGIIVFSE